MSSVTCTFYSS